MNELTRGGEQFMTVQEVAEVLGVTSDGIRWHIRDMWPDKMQNGKQTYLSQEEVYEIQNRMNNWKVDLSGRCLYMIHAKSLNYYKIGMSIKPRERFYNINNVVPLDLNLIFYMEHKSSSKIEYNLHGKYKAYSIKPEWFNLDYEHALECLYTAVNGFISPREHLKLKRRFFIDKDWYESIISMQDDNWYEGNEHRFIQSKISEATDEIL